jgi:hypothetical protein
VSVLALTSRPAFAQCADLPDHAALTEALEVFLHGHPECGFEEAPIATALPETDPIGPAE